MSRPDLILWGLHGLRLKPFASGDDLAEIYGVDGSDFIAVLDHLAESRWAKYRTAAPCGWIITPAGMAHLDTLVRAELESSGFKFEIGDCYQQFIPLNSSLLELCVRWQAGNDRDPLGIGGTDSITSSTQVLIGELGLLNERAQPLCVELGLLLSRYAHYANRLSYAFNQVVDGAHEWFTGATIASYHTVWFELHTDLLATLGLDRATETAKANSSRISDPA